MEKIKGARTLGEILTAQRLVQEKQTEEKYEERRRAFKAKLREYKAQFVAMGIMKPEEKLTAKDIRQIFTSLGFDYPSNAFKYIWGHTGMTMNGLLEMMEDPEFFEPPQ